MAEPKHPVDSEEPETKEKLESTSAETQDGEIVTPEVAVEEKEAVVVSEAEPEPELTRDDDSLARVSNKKHSSRFKRFLLLGLNHKKLSIPLAVIILLAIVCGIPQTRYPVFGLFLKQTYRLSVSDSITHQPVSDVHITLDGMSALTNSSGVATIKLPVGRHTLSLSKQYYAGISRSVLVPIHPKQMNKLAMVATGFQVPITVVNNINGQPITDALVSADKSDVKTNARGQATIVLPADKSTAAATIAVSGYNSASATIHITTQTLPANSFSVTPVGKVYFLSNLSGKIDVVKTNLDGTDRQTVLPGSGFEDDDNTVLLASRDWKYLALYSIRKSGGNPEINLIDTTNGDKLTNIDEGNADFSLIGWSGDYFTYLVSRQNYPSWQPGAESIKSYNAQTNKLAVLDTTQATGSSDYDAEYESIFSSNVHILGSKLVYDKTWYAYPGYLQTPGKQDTLNYVGVDGTSKQVISTLDAGTQYFGSLTAEEPDTLLSEVDSVNSTPNSQVFYDYTTAGGYTKNTDLTDSEEQLSGYPTYLLSPSGKLNFWSVVRDGKNTLFIGDQNGDNQKQIATLSDYKAYGWYSDNYLLVSQNGSELYIMPVAGGTPIKITDYHKPQEDFAGYGGGYGGL